MALTITLAPMQAFDYSGQYAGAQLVYANLTGDTSYPAGAGYPTTVGNWGLKQQIIAVTATQPLTGSYVIRYDERSAAIRWYVASSTNALTEVSTGASLSGIVVNVACWGW